MKSNFKLVLLALWISFSAYGMKKDTLCGTPLGDLLSCFSSHKEKSNRPDSPDSFTFYQENWVNPKFKVAKKHKPIYEAICKGDLKKTIELFEKSDFGITEDAPFIHIAAASGHEHIVKYFLEKGASANELCLAKKELKPSRRRPYRNPSNKQKAEQRVVTLNLPASYAPDNSGVIETLVKEGADLEIIGSTPTLLSRIQMKEKLKTMEFLLKHGGATINSDQLGSEHLQSGKILRSMCKKNTEALEQSGRQSPILESDIFAHNKLDALERLISSENEKNRNEEKPAREELEDRDWSDIFKRVMFGQEFFKKENASRFANTRDFKDINGQTVLGIMKTKKDLLIKNPHFLPMIIASIGYQYKTGLEDFLIKLSKNNELTPKKLKSLDCAEQILVFLLKTKTVALRQKRQAQTYLPKPANLELVKREREKHEKLQETAERFLQTLKNTVRVTAELCINWKSIPTDCAFHILTFSDGDFAAAAPKTKKLQKSAINQKHCSVQ